MPNLNVLTWNSNGESAAKAAFLHNLIVNNPTVGGWMPDVIVIQEAQAAPGGALFAMLAGLGAPGNAWYNANYHNVAPQHVAIPGEGYILMTSAAAAAGPFAAVNLAADPGVVAAIAAQPHAQQGALTAAALTDRAPAHAQIAFGGRTVECMTWHAPLGPGLMHGISAGVNYSAYFFLQSSNFYNNTLCTPGAPGGNANIGLIPADLNVTPVDLNNPTLCPAVPHLLPNWAARSHNLDHIAAREDGGDANIGFAHAGFHPVAFHGAHAVFVSTVIWP